MLQTITNPYTIEKLNRNIALMITQKKNILPSTETILFSNVFYFGTDFNIDIPAIADIETYIIKVSCWLDAAGGLVGIKNNDSNVLWIENSLKQKVSRYIKITNGAKYNLHVNSLFVGVHIEIAYSQEIDTHIADVVDLKS